MELTIKKLNEQKIKSTGGKSTKMGLSDDAQSMIFNMFTETIYKNPIGSIVREITSNCFDAHVEAGNESPENPVFVKKTHDKLSDTHYISFFDNGVGMSPDRVENIYGIYFNSTKRANNDEIGGFGIGGKTPLAYKRSYIDEEGNTQYDSSFFVITRYNGIEYSYTIYNGEESPEIQLMNEASTKKGNGTEIRIPIKESDLQKFEREILRQLYYFENIVFQGFDIDNELNSYNVHKGEHFIYRGDRYEESVHLCLGKVAYKIDYSDLGLSEYDYRIPIALRFEIGDIQVTPNRESMQYNEKTIKLIKEKIELATQELVEMLEKQYANVKTIEEYYMAKENFGNVMLPQTNETLYVGKLVKKSMINYDKFKYKAVPTFPKSDKIIEMFFNVREFGKKKGTSWSPQYSSELNIGVYQCANKFNRKIVKQAWLSKQHDKNYMIIMPYDFEGKDADQLEKVKKALGLYKEDTNSGQFTLSLVPVIPEKKAMSLIKKMRDEVYKWVMSNIESYDDLEVPQEFIDGRKKKKDKLSAEILKTTIPVKDPSRYGKRRRVKVRQLANYAGRIYFGTTDEEHLISYGSELFQSLFGSDRQDTFNRWGSDPFSLGKGVLFVMIAKTNEKYLRMCRNAYHISTLYPTMLHRKMINPANIKIANEYIQKYNKLDDLYCNDNFHVINKVVKDYHTKVKAEIETLEKYKQFEYVNFDHYLISKYFDTNQKADISIKTERELNYLLEVESKNEKTLRWIEMPYNMSSRDLLDDYYGGLVSILKKVMVF